MSPTQVEVPAPVPVVRVSAHVQRCGGVTCLPGTCDHDEEVQRHADGPGPAAVPPSVLGVLGTAGAPLDGATRTSMEGRFGHDFGRVRIHTDADAARSAAEIQASAYTFGSHVVMGASRYQPHTASGQRLLAHELTHVVQQGDQVGSPSSISHPTDPGEHQAAAVADATSAPLVVPLVPPDIQRKALVGPEDDPFEREADAIADDVMGHSALPPAPGGAGGTPPPDGDAPGPPPPPTSIDGEAGLSSGGSPMPPRVRRFFEERFGHDLSEVRIHADGESARHNELLQSHAFTYGHHVWLDAGIGVEPSFVLAHELAHVLQQTQPQALGDATAPRAVQRIPYWEPRHETGTTAHRRLIPAVAEASDVFGEAPVPERGTGAGGLGTRGEADFYKAAGPGGNNTVGVRFNADADPVWLRAPGDMVVPPGSGYLHATSSAPQGPRRSDGTITRVDQAPTHIWLGEMKPAFGADPEPQLTRYEEAFREARKHTNDYPRREPAGTTWNLDLSRFDQSGLTIPADYTPGSTSQATTEVILKEFDLDKGSVRKFLREQGFPAVQARLFVKFEGNPGSWVYAWVPDHVPPNPRLPRSIASLGQDVAHYVRDPLFVFPIKPKPKKAVQKLPRPARAPGAVVPARSVRREQLRRIRRKQADPFRAGYTKWKADVAKYSTQWASTPKADKERLDAANDLVLAHRRLFTDGWTREPLTAAEEQAHQTHDTVRMWTGKSAETVGFVRYHFGWLFEKVANAYDWIRERIHGALGQRTAKSQGDSLTKAAIQTALKLLKIAGRILLSRTFDLLENSLVQGVEAKITEWAGVSTTEALDQLAADLDSFKDQLAAAALQDIEQLLGESVINQVVEILDELDGLQDMIRDISGIVSLVKWGVRIIECLSPPGWGCLWIIVSAVGEELLAELLESCWFQAKVAPHVTALPWLNKLPAMLAGAVIGFVDDQLPGPLKGLLKPITVDTAVSPGEVACPPGQAGGGGGRAVDDSALVDAMIQLAGRVGEDRLRAFARMSQRMGVPAGRPLTPEDLWEIGDAIIANGATAADMDQVTPESVQGGTLRVPGARLAEFVAQKRDSSPKGPVDTGQQWGVTRTEHERRERERARQEAEARKGQAKALQRRSSRRASRAGKRAPSTPRWCTAVRGRARWTPRSASTPARQGLRSPVPPCGCATPAPATRWISR